MILLRSADVHLDSHRPVIFAHAYYIHEHTGLAVEYVAEQRWHWPENQPALRPDQINWDFRRWYNFDLPEVRIALDSPYPYITEILKHMGFVLDATAPLRLCISGAGRGFHLYWKENPISRSAAAVLKQYLAIQRPERRIITANGDEIILYPPFGLGVPDPLMALAWWVIAVWHLGMEF